ncbi:MarR family winged helix-turn-helix transcriptional regulator [Ruegeria atlantica]|uniref:MarR family winged helix-turn-helix transcriptional regulator n=1 Tax=Ruegeria atlantica TaxID=81569 RepID=UPI001480B8D3|nr:MarR family transcriptional regulator [Ruegeria atlantica]
MKIQDVDPPEFHLTVLNRQIRDMMNGVLRRHGLKLVEWRMLQCLADEGSLSVCDLSSLVVVERTATGRLVDRLAEKGLVQKKQMPNDRRFSVVTLRPKGREWLAKCSEDVDHARTQLFAGLGQDDIQQFLEVLQILQRNAGLAAIPRRAKS